ncbi:MAG TPA: ATP-binding protein [Pseudorhizobium sp.]|jgi:hypothetical protein|nr:ATP-binding protein [Pseudorhizobium sp.]
MLDFTRLRSEVGGHRSAFEGLVCQLARRHPPKPNSRFTAIDGAGGDGGLEAYWTDPAGREHGYQAKFHTKSGDIDWRKIDGSVNAALTAHPNMTHMVIAIACDLTDTVPGRKGKSGREHWDAHRRNWLTTAANLYREVTFDLWDASTIEDMLVDNLSVGLRSYWFGEVELTPEWFRRVFQRAESSLEERYSPDDHVDVSAEDIFGGLLRDRRLQAQFETRLASVAESIPKNRHRLHEDVDNALDVVRELAGGLTTTCKIELDPTRPLEIEKYKCQIDALRLACSDARAIIKHCRPREVNSTRGSDSGTERAYGEAESSVWELDSACEELRDFIDGTAVEADTKRAAIVIGRAGTGKSHLLAAEVDQLTSAQIPAVMILGTQFSHTSGLVEQFPRLMGLNCSFTTLLDTLNAAAEAIASRALIAIDAINEGGGRRWRSELGPLIDEIKTRPWLAFVCSCRSEYEPYTVTDGTKQKAAAIHIEGFTTEEEQDRAAEIYLDKRGILRPATPWLSPEFSNPLFLRTTSVALAAAGRHEYPSGLHGTKEVFRFYLDFVGRHLGMHYDGSDALMRPITRAVQKMAAHLAHKRSDHLALGDAHAIVNGAFSNVANQDRTWLELLHLRGIIRFDPNAMTDPDDPLDEPEHVVRFGFQRFQDHLVAEALLDSTRPEPSAFVEEGPLSFLLQRFDHFPHVCIAYEWHGVFQALWIAHAERNRRELIDDLPTESEELSLHFDDFIETIYWRSPNAFSARTLELFNLWLVDNRSYSDLNHIRILLRLSTREHPWNIELLDKNLWQRSMPKRDVFWTVPLNALGRYGDENSEAFRLARWCQGPAVARADDSVLERALKTLGWLLATTNNNLRDHATKGAIAILLSRARLLPGFVAHFADVDDPYVLERVVAACAGACLRDPTKERLSEAAIAIYEALFVSGSPPTHLLTRDYGRLIVELAIDKDVLPDAVMPAKCRPPYGSAAPKLPKSTERTEARAKTAGADAILQSCTGWIGDFGRYVIESRLRDFSSIRLNTSAPQLPDVGRYDFKRSNCFDARRARLWVVNRTLSLGWTQTRFPKDATIDDNRHSGGRIERIGKKYQWVAFYELLSRLADNYWMFDNDRDPAFRQYDNAVDTGFVRDIEITIPPIEDNLFEINPEYGIRNIPIDEVTVDRQAGWVFENGITDKSLRLGLAEDVTGEGSWYTLYRYSRTAVDWDEKEKSSVGHPLRQEEFHFQMMIGLPTTEVSAIVRRLIRDKPDFHDWLPEQYTDAGYLYELAQRSTWDDCRDGRQSGWGDTPGYRQFTLGYLWEHHLDRTVPSGLSLQVPAPWLIRDLQLQAEPGRLVRYLESDGTAVVVGGKSLGSQWCIARRDKIDALMDREGLTPLWIGIGERSAWPNKGGGTSVPRRRWNGFMQLKRQKAHFTKWAQDDSYHLR